jgi:hypothetical protein
MFRKLGHFLGVAIEAVGEDKECWRPEADEQSETFRMRLRFWLRSTREVPDPYRSDDRRESENEAQMANKFELVFIHAIEYERQAPADSVS